MIDGAEHQERRAGVGRRAFLQGGAALLASVGAVAATGTRADAARGAATAAPDLALYRPVEVSSRAYAPTPAHFAVDRLGLPGVRGSGWRAEGLEPQWIAVDLQTVCDITSVRLVFEATEGDVVYKPADDVNPRNGTSGWEVLSSYATAFTIEVSSDGHTWRSAQEGTTAIGGAVDVDFPASLRARWVRMTASARSNPNPIGLNGFQVFGTERGRRPAATGWTDWTSGGDPVRPLRLASDGTVPIESGWNVTLEEFAGEDGAALSGPGVDTSTWLRAEVPGTILAALVDGGHLPDPVNGFANLEVPEALGKSAWWYRRTFSLPHRFRVRGHDRIWLEFDGINHYAEVWLDGQLIGEQTHPFARGSFDVTAMLATPGDHALAVRIDPMPFPGSPGDKGPDGVPYADAGSGIMMRNAPTYLAVSGWDWMPAVRDRVMGIWNHVRLRSSGPILVQDALVSTVLPDLPDVGVAEVTLTVPVRNASAVSQRTVVSAAFAGIRVERTVIVPAGITEDVEFTPAEFPALRITEPQLWWPNGYGDPTLHGLVLSASVGSITSDQRTVRIGLRQTAYESENPVEFPPGADRYVQQVDLPRQESRYIRIRSPRKATGFGVSLWTLSVRESADGGNVDLARSAVATASSTDNPSNPPENAIDGNDQTRWSSAYEDDQWIQLDLGSKTPFDSIELTWERAYALSVVVETSADGATWTETASIDNRPRQLRIVVNGVPVLCRGGNWGWDELLRRMGNGRMEAVVGMHRDMNFTMIRNWLGSSNREEFYARCDENGLLVWNDFWNAWFLDPPDHEVYLAQVRETVRRYRSHPCLVVWCGANEGTPSGEIDSGARTIVAEEHPDVHYVSNSAAGTVSGGGPYAWIDPQRYFSADTYGQRTFGFHTEIGIPTVSVVESMQNLVGDEEGWPIGTVWNYHDWATAGNQYPQNYLAAIDERLGASSSLEEFATKAQFVNFESMRAMFEAWNANLWEDATGLLLWMSNPAWHSTVWQTYDYDLDVNGSYYGSRSGCEPLHVQADPRDGRVVALNHTGTDVRGAVVQAELLDLTGRSIGRATRKTVDLPAAAKTDVFTVPAPGGDRPLHLLRLRLLDAARSVLSENVYWRYTTPGDMKALGEAERAALRITDTTVEETDERFELSIDLRNDGDRVAAMVRLSLLDRRSGLRVLPATYSENYFWLFPGERRRVGISCTARGDLRMEHLQVRAQSYGTDAATSGA